MNSSRSRKDRCVLPLSLGLILLLIIGSMHMSMAALPKVAKPTFSPGGGTYYSPQNVAISCTEPNATIRYTLDDSTPTSNSTIYSDPILVNLTTTIKAKAFKINMTDSDTASATYTIKVATPTFNPAEGTYSSPQNVTISCETVNATIRYTLDGSQPSSTSTLYVGPVLINATKTLKARAFYNGMSASNIATAVYNITLQVATPTFSPAEGSYSSPQNVTILCATVGATIRYTTNGSEPSSTSNMYTGPILVNAPTTIRAKAYKTGMLESNISQAVYNITLPKVASPTFSPPGGNYISPQNIAISCTTPDASIKYTTDGSEPNIASTAYSNPIPVNSTTIIKAKAFKVDMTESDTASENYIINLPKVATPTFTPGGGTYTSAQSVTLQCATVGATIRYTVDGSIPTSTSTEYLSPILVEATTKLSAKAFLNGWIESDVATATYTISLPIPQVATPAFNPPGGTYTSSQSVDIQCETLGATIRYTTDGTEPSSSSTVYSGVISVSTTTTINAKAFKNGMTDSNTASATYVISLPKIATPRFSPPGGTYSSPQTATIYSDTPDAIVRYTLDGSEPTSSSTTYSNPIQISATTTIKAKAYKNGMAPSDTASATFIINTPIQKVAAPIFNPAGGTFPGAQSIEIQCSTVGATIRYTLDGSEPTSASAAYSTPISVASTTTVKAKAFKTGMTDSDTSLATYTINNPVPAKVATPSFSPGGGSYSSAQYVTIQCATAGTIIRYTTNGDEPTNSSAIYSNPISVTYTTTIRTKAFLSGMVDSDTASATYTIKAEPHTKVATPTFSPVGGTYSSAQSVVIKCDTSGATIRFTMFGEEPTVASSLYSGPISVSVNTVIKAKAFLTGMIESDTALTTYLFTTEVTSSQPVSENLSEYGVIAAIAAIIIVAAAVGGIMLLRNRKKSRV